MRKKIVSLTGTVALMSMLTSAAFAYEAPGENDTNPTKLTISSQVNSNSQNQAVTTTTNQSQELTNLKLQVSLLESAIAPESSKDANG